MQTQRQAVALMVVVALIAAVRTSGGSETVVTVSKAAAKLYLIQVNDIVIQANNSVKRDEEAMREFCGNCNAIIFIIIL